MNPPLGPIPAINLQGFLLRSLIYVPYKAPLTSTVEYEAQPDISTKKGSGQAATQYQFIRSRLVRSQD